MDSGKKRFVTAVAVMVGMCIGAGVLGIPYVASQAGFFVALGYIAFLGIVILYTNLYLGEISLRTKEDHQLPGYVSKYLGRKGGWLMQFSMMFLGYAALVAYLTGVGESLSVLFFGAGDYTFVLGVGFGLLMSYLIWRGMKALKRFEKIGVAIILGLLILIVIIFSNKIDFVNLYGFEFANVFLPFGVILFAFISFQAIPEIEIVLRGHEKMMKKVIFTSMLICIVFYALFTFVVVGFKGVDTPEIATLALGGFFILLGILTMFTSYLAIGIALLENFMFDEEFPKIRAWVYTSMVPIVIFLFIRIFDVFSFTRILSIGGTISGGLMAILILLMIKNAKEMGDRKPEFTIPFSKVVMWILILIFVLGVIWEVYTSVMGFL